MSVLYTVIEVESEDIPLRRAAEIVREGMRLMAHNHRMVTMGKHFQKNAETAPGGGYGYVPRRAKYVEKKLKRYGIDLPNVRTGEMRRAAKSNSYVTATQYRSAVHFKFRRAIKDQQRSELEIVTPEEAREASEDGQTYVRNQFFDRRNHKKRKRKIT